MKNLVTTFLQEQGFSEEQITFKFELWLNAFEKYGENRVAKCFSLFLENQENNEKCTIANVLKRMPKKESFLTPEELQERAFYSRKSIEFSDLVLKNLKKIGLNMMDFFSTDRLSFGKKMEFINFCEKEFIEKYDVSSVKKLRQMAFFEDLI